MVGPQMWEPAGPTGFIPGFSRKYPGSRRGQRTSASLGAVRMRGAEEKTGRQEKSLSEWMFYLRLLLRSIDCFRGQAAVTRHLFWFL